MGRTMPRLALVLMLLASAPAVAAEPSPPPAVQGVKEAAPATGQAAGAERKLAERKSGEPPNSPRDTPKLPVPALEGKNLGLGCAEN